MSMRATESRERPFDDHGVVVPLRSSAALSVDLVGAKAASLARSLRAGSPVLPGFVVTTRFDARLLDTPDAAALAPVMAAWSQLSDEGRTPLVVRSSATKEDGDTSSLAGMFVSRLDVRGWSAFVAAVTDVLASATRAGVPDTEMAVLVQPLLRPTWGGVLFGADPVTERTDRMVVAAVAGGPDQLVSGEVDGWNATLTRRGRVITETEGHHPGPRELRLLTSLARRLERLYGQPQDIEWAIDDAGALYLLQARPITTLHGPVHGPVYGPGPVAETFPDALAPLEEDLWLDPLRDGLRHALALLGTVPGGRLKRAPLVISVAGRPAVDLGLLGEKKPGRKLWRAIDPRPPVRRLRAAWRVGRLATALPDLALDLAREVDADLADVPALDGLSNRELLRILDNAAPTLRALHAYEALAGSLLRPDPAVTAATLALDALREAQAGDLPAADVMVSAPVVLALVPPHIPPVDELPPAPVTAGPGRDHDPTMEGIARETLRLRARWVQELTARVAAELGRRLAAVRLLSDPAAVRYLRLEELRTLLRTRQPFHPDGRPDAMRRSELPTRFRLTDDGTPIDAGPLDGTGDASTVGTAVGGGRGRGIVRTDPAEAGPGVVLVVRTLDPRLAAVIPQLAGLIAETGSPLSHLAILAREHGVPTVVGRAGALAHLTPGDAVEVDGTTGSVVHVCSGGTS